MDMMIVEYFCDKERTQLHVQETKELQVRFVASVYVLQCLYTAVV